MKEIKFKEYFITYKKHKLKILTPAKPIEQLWITPEARDDMTFWDGNRFAFQTLLEAAKIMTQSKNIIIYFPLRKAKYAKDWFDCAIYDMVWLNHQHGIRCSDFKSIKQKILKQKHVKYYDKNYNSVKILEKCKQLTKQLNREYHYNGCPFETKINHTMFYRFPIMFYASMVLELKKYLNQYLEQAFWKHKSFSTKDAIGYTWLGGEFYARHRYIHFCVEIGFYDIQLDKRKLEKQKRR